MGEQKDFRLLCNGRIIPSENYCDQPYLLHTSDGAWLCVLTTGRGREGERGQHIVTLRSEDCGKTWNLPVDVEPPDGPESSYAVLLQIPSGRVYCFYNHNTDNVRRARADTAFFPDGYTTRVDSLGHFVLRYSDDCGRSWSDQRYEIPIRAMEIDRQNPYGGELMFFWNVGRPFLREGTAFVPLIKIGGFGQGFFSSTEGVLLRCGNLCDQADPRRLTWETLPEGERGLRTPKGGGPVAEEQSYCVLGDGSLFCVYRTVDGHPASAYSRDGGRSWEEPRYHQYEDGILIGHPRAANVCWKCGNGKYLYWFHNNGGRGYEGRNPVFLAGGVEVSTPEGSCIRWGRGEVLLYDDDPSIRISYPDFLEQDGRYYFTQTQKSVARVHEIPTALIESLWEQFTARTFFAEGIAAAYERSGVSREAQQLRMPVLPLLTRRDESEADGRTLDCRGGITLELRAALPQPGEALFDSRDAQGAGICLRRSWERPQRLELEIGDSRIRCLWDSEALPDGEGTYHIAVILDGGPKLIRFVVEGKPHDGGDGRIYGFGRYSPALTTLNGAECARVSERVSVLRLYDRPLLLSQIIGNWRSGM